MARPSTPAYHLGYIVTAHAVGTATIALLIALFLREKLGLHAIAPACAVATVLVPVLAAEPTRRRENPTQFGHANRITLFRAILIAAVATLLGFQPSEKVAMTATGVAMIALILDGLDGFVARKTDCMSDYGAQLDMELDAFFTLLLSALVYQWGFAGEWVLFCGLARYAWLLVQLFVPWFARPLPPEPAFRRKTACVLGVGGLILALYPWGATWLNTGFAGIATTALAVSFSIDAMWLINRRKEPLSC